MKRVIILHPDGSERVLEKPPTWTEMRQYIGGGWLECIRVLDHVGKRGTFIYTYMYVDEEGVIKGQERNARATEVYQRAVREAFPDAVNPFAAARQAAAVQAARAGFFVVNLETPTGYRHENPHIAGVAVFWEGYRCEEIDALLEGDDSD